MRLNGTLAAVISSALGGTAYVATRPIVSSVDPITLGVLRFGLGAPLLLLAALLMKERWPARRDWPAMIALGLLMFGLFPVLFNISLIFTTAARAALAVSTLPLITMLVSAALKIEALTLRKTAGVVLAMGGVAVALYAGLATAPEGAWRGDLIMGAGAICMSFYTIWSRPYVHRAGALSFTTIATASGAAALCVISIATGGIKVTAGFDASAWGIVAYLAVFGAAVIYWLWSYAVSHTTPTRVAISMAVNPLSAGVFGALLLAEPVGWSLVLGLVAVTLGIWLAATGHVSVASEATPPPA